ncbi:hypothetical protein [Halomonas sp. YLGW01]|uniref:hypothetical protein n=1 Tax=Halomonas sp. YLGW01 TaxID=2773308 RepID=UPI001783067A|nr:hypothetical protein [Halomonas sp. YLGW01]
MSITTYYSILSGHEYYLKGSIVERSLIELLRSQAPRSNGRLERVTLDTLPVVLTCKEWPEEELINRDSVINQLPKNKGRNIPIDIKTLHTIRIDIDDIPPGDIDLVRFIFGQLSRIHQMPETDKNKTQEIHGIIAHIENNSHIKEAIQNSLYGGETLQRRHYVWLLANQRGTSFVEQSLRRARSQASANKVTSDNEVANALKVASTDKVAHTGKETNTDKAIHKDVPKSIDEEEDNSICKTSTSSDFLAESASRLLAVVRNSENQRKDS